MAFEMASELTATFKVLQLIVHALDQAGVVRKQAFLPPLREMADQTEPLDPLAAKILRGFAEVLQRQLSAEGVSATVSEFPPT